MIYSVFKIDGKQVTKKEYERYKWLQLHPKIKGNRKNANNVKRTHKNKIQKPKKVYASYTEYLQSPEWKKIRKRILKRANYKCEVCKVMRAYQVHHKTYKRIFNERDSDLIAICGACHQDKHKILTDEQIEKRVNKLMTSEGYV